MDISEQIESDIKELKNCRYSDDKQKQYNQIATGLKGYFKVVNQAKFTKDLILSFFVGGFFPKSTQYRHTKNILTALKEKGIISDTVKTKIGHQQRVYQLRTNDFGSYSALMNNNGFNTVNYYVWECDSEGIPRKNLVGTSRINGLPEDKNGLPVEDWDLSELKQTIPRRKQGVYSYGNKSISVEKRPYSVKCYQVN